MAKQLTPTSVMPKPCLKVRPRRWYDSASQVGSGAPPLKSARTEERSTPASSGVSSASSSIFQIVGTPSTTVQRSRSTVRQISTGSKPRWRTMRPPMVTIGTRNANRPPAW